MILEAAAGPSAPPPSASMNKYLNTGQSAVEDFLLLLHFSLWLLETFIDDTKVQKDPDASKLVVVVPETDPVKTCQEKTAVPSEETCNGLWRLKCFWWSYLSHQSGSLSDRRPCSLKPWEHPVVSWPSQTAVGRWPYLLSTVPVFRAWTDHTDRYKSELKETQNNLKPHTHLWSFCRCFTLNQMYSLHQLKQYMLISKTFPHLSRIWKTSDTDYLHFLLSFISSISIVSTYCICISAGYMEKLMLIY